MAGDKKQGYIWEKKSNRELLLMPEACEEHFLANPTMPVDLKRAGIGCITTPKNSAADSFLKSRGIISASVSTHKRGFYLSRAGVDFHLAIFSREGEALLNLNGAKRKISKGCVFFAPAGSVFEYTALKDWRVFWFHIENAGPWLMGRAAEPFLKKASYGARIYAAMADYLAEADCAAPSRKLMGAYADVMDEFLKRELCPAASQDPEFCRLEDFAAAARADLSRPPSAASAAAALGVSKAKLHRLCMKYWGAGFAKIMLEKRMEAAMQMVTEARLSNARIAEAVGYATPFAFSKSYKAYFGVSPRGSRPK